MNRSHGIGGSDVGPLLGLDPRKTPYQLWREKLGLDGPMAATPATLRGQFLEPLLLERYRAEIEPVSLTDAVHIEDGWRLGNLDAVATMADGQRRVVEAKSVSRHVFAKDWGAPWTDEVPDRALCQGCWYASLLPATCVDYIVAVMPDDPDQVLGLDARSVLEQCDVWHYRVIPVAGVTSILIDRARNFWECVTNKVPPPPATVEDVSLRWPAHVNGRVRVATDEVIELIRRYESLGESERTCKDERDRVRLELLRFGEDCEAITNAQGSPLVTLKAVERKEYVVKSGTARQVRLTKWWQKTNEKTQPQQEIPL